MRPMRLKRPLPANKADEANGAGPMRPLMSWAGNTMIWRRLLAFVVPAIS